MMQDASFREKLTSAVAAIALQLGFAALLAVSFTVVRQVTAQKETILTLPPLPREKPQPQRAPMVIDARPKAAPQSPPAAVPPPVPALTTAGPVLGNGQNAIQLAPKPLLPDCRPEKYAGPNAADAKACPPPAAATAKSDSDLVGLLPPSRAKDEARQGKTPPSGNSSGVSITAGGPGIQITVQDPLCKLASLFLKIQCGARPTYNLSTDAQFQAARAAVQARTGAIYGKPVLASPPQAGGGNEKGTVSGGGAGGGTDAAGSPGR